MGTVIGIAVAAAVLVTVLLLVLRRRGPTGGTVANDPAAGAWSTSQVLRGGDTPFGQ